MLSRQAGSNLLAHKAVAPPVRRASGVAQRFWLALLCAVVALWLSGCASPEIAGPRPFVFERDTFDYANELVWEYGYDASGKWTTRRREPPPTYYQHCFVVAKSARQFFFNARFDPNLPAVEEVEYRCLVKRVTDSNARRRLPPDELIVIPGFSNLREFSRSKENILKEECGAAWESYFQRGHWRMIFPFSRRHQARTAQQIQRSIDANRPVVLHVVRFPQLSINHALVAFDWASCEHLIEFAIYDPNQPESPAKLIYDKETRTFEMPGNNYFRGGRVDVYEVFKNWRY